MTSEGMYTYPNLQVVAGQFIARAKGRSWIDKALSSIPAARGLHDLLQRLDNIIGEMPKEQWGMAKVKFDRIVPLKVQSWSATYDEQFHEVLIEILGWGWLKVKYIECQVTFVDSSLHKGKSPDLHVLDGSASIVAAMECKHLGNSEKEKAWIRSMEVISGPVANTPTADDPNENPFLRKLNSTVDRAKEQVNSTGLPSNKFIFMNLSLDTPFWGMPDVNAGMTELVQRMEGKLREEGIELVAFEGYRPEQRFGTS